MKRGTGGNRFILGEASRGDLLKSINDQLGDLYEWALQTGRQVDLGAITIDTKRIPSGAISVTVEGDLTSPTTPGLGERLPDVSDEDAWGSCTTCPGDARYAAPGRHHIQGCTYPTSPGDLGGSDG